MRTRSLPLVLVVCLLSGCLPWWTTPAKIGADLATTAAEERKIPEAERDFTAKANIINTFINDAPALLIQVNADVYQGQVMLTGAVPDKLAATLAEQLVRQVEGVQQVFNDIEVIEQDELQRVMRDTGTEYKVKATLLAALGVRSRNYRWRSVNDTVYLIGIAQSQEELDEVWELIMRLDEVHDVVSHVRIKPSIEPAAPDAIPISGRGSSEASTPP